MPMVGNGARNVWLSRSTVNPILQHHLGCCGPPYVDLGGCFGGRSGNSSKCTSRPSIEEGGLKLCSSYGIRVIGFWLIVNGQGFST